MEDPSSFHPQLQQEHKYNGFNLLLFRIELIKYNILQFICGIGIPVEDLAYESVTSGYVLKAEYFLPTKSEELHYDYLKPMSMNGRKVRSLNETDPFFRKTIPAQSVILSNIKDRHNDLSKYRWLIYKALETLSQRTGQEGKVCMLRAICEYAESPFHFESGFLAEILHIILT